MAKNDGEFSMLIRDVFHFADGRTVFAGELQEGEALLLCAGPAQLFDRGRLIAEFEIEPEMLPSRSDIWERQSIRAVSTNASIKLLSGDIDGGTLVLKGRMRMTGHRDLVGIDSPPDDFVADTMTLGPRLPRGWDGDAWTSPDESHYFLRAWNKATARYAIATGDRYDEARKTLLGEIAAGGKPVIISAREAS